MKHNYLSHAHDYYREIETISFGFVGTRTIDDGLLISEAEDGAEIWLIKFRTINLKRSTTK